MQNFMTASKKILAQFADMWKGKLKRIDAVDHRIDLMQDSRPFSSAPNQIGPKTHGLEVLEIQKQLKADVIEPFASECASLVLFLFKNTDRFDFV